MSLSAAKPLKYGDPGPFLKAMLYKMHPGFLKTGQ